MCPIFVGSLHNVYRSDDDVISEKILSSNRCICGFMPKAHKNSYMVSVVVLFYLFETAHESSIKKGESNDDK